MLNQLSLPVHASPTATCFCALIAAASLSSAAGCSGGIEHAPALAEVYNQAAQYHRPGRNPVIVIPGIMGSRVIDQPDGVIIWGAFARGGANPRSATGARLVALPIDPAQPVGTLSDGAVADRVLDRLGVNIIGLPFEMQAYSAILTTLGAGGYRDQMLAEAGVIDYGAEHFTCFQFPYDWRLDNVANARRLARFIDEKRAYVQSEYARRFGIEDYPVKFDLVAHSMGGLLARYYLQFGTQDIGPAGELPLLTWAGAEHVERVVLVGTPNAGTATALLNLVQGRDFGRPFLPFYPPAVLGTFPSMYQLLPRSRHRPVRIGSQAEAAVEDVFDPALWVRFGWGLVDPAQEPLLEQLLPHVKDAGARRVLAREQLTRHLAQARAFAAALDRPAPLPEGLRLYLVFGDGEPTPQTLRIDEKTGRLEVISRAPGDQSVLRESVLLDERAGSPWRPFVRTPLEATAWLALPDDHLGLTRSVAFRDNLLFWLLEEPRPAHQLVEGP